MYEMFWITNQTGQKKLELDRVHVKLDTLN